MRLLLVCVPGEARDQYQRALEELGVGYDAVSSLSELHHELIKSPYNGLLLDVPTQIRADAREKALTHDLLELFPALRLSWDAEAGRIRAMYYGQAGESGDRLEDFIRTQAETFAARTIRRAVRKDLSMCVILSRAGGGKAEHTAVVNLSREGCFVLTTAPWQPGEEAQLSAPDLDGKALAAPIKATCRRVVSWGGGLRLPGIGIRFEDMTAGQRTNLDALLEPNGEQANGASN